jgi:hypothetical protein
VRLPHARTPNDPQPTAVRARPAPPLSAALGTAYPSVIWTHYPPVGLRLPRSSSCSA